MKNVIARWRLFHAARIIFAGCLIFYIGAGLGWAREAELPKEAVLSLELGQKAANVALAKCEEEGYRVRCNCC